MIQIDNIGDEPHQNFTFNLENGELILSLRLFDITQMWSMSVSYNGKNYDGMKLSVGTLHMRSANFPFDFIVEDTSGADIDPYKADDFSTGRCVLYRLNAEEMESIRGQKVE